MNYFPYFLLIQEDSHYDDGDDPVWLHSISLSFFHCLLTDEFLTPKKKKN